VTPARKTAQLARRVVDWFGRHARDLPWRRTNDPYAIWISEVMLQQTQVKMVIPYWERWMRRFPNAAALAVAPEPEVLKAWEGLGYYSRARNLQKAARVIVEKFAGEFPNKFDEVLSLPGVGEYTAGAICSIAFGQAAAILDGNVVRVLARVFAVGGDPKSSETRRRLWTLSSECVKAAEPWDACSALNQGIMELGAMICTPRQPRCGECPLRADCAARKTGRVGQFPETKPRAKSRKRNFAAFLFVRGQEALIRQRGAGEVNGGFWEFPNFPAEDSSALAAVRERFPQANEFAVIRHSIMNDRITIVAFLGRISEGGAALAREFSAEWRKQRELEALPFTGAHSKLRARLLAGVGNSGQGALAR